jgi:DMSO/TMAO reductase YedYZ molybdopterin-dependent catalytic subunit
MSLRGKTLDRRSFLTKSAAAAGTLALGGCDGIPTPRLDKIFAASESLTRRAQRLLLSRSALAKEYSEADISPQFRANGTTEPDTPEYRALAETNFIEWRLEVSGLVEQPSQFSLAGLRQLPSRAQITQHDCVEGWSCIGKWRGAQLSAILEQVRLKPEARYIVFRCADALEATLDGSGQYYENIDLVDAFHPQTILAYEMNDKPLPVAHGAPLRLRVERQLGYKMAKYVMQIEAVASFESIAGGKGGYWEDRGYEWYAGI